MKIEVNNITLNYNKEGNGQPLILLHGNGEDHHIFDKLIAKLKNDFTVYAIDTRNHGESSQTGVYEYAAMSEDIFQFIQMLNLKDVSIVGFSDGAIISLLTEIKHPSTFKKMVLLGVNLKPSDFTKESYDYLIDEYEKTQDPLIKLMLEQPNIELSDVAKVKIPTFLIMAEDDIYKREMLDSILDILPHAQSKIIEGHDHGSYIIDNDMLYPDLKGFLL
ncbi:MAG: alpha/beta fold hydrolase [Dysgonomonas sp.]|nr:alpha/beta fold hydrolase [Dysgonomonas sp.]